MAASCMPPEKARWILLWLRKANQDFRRAAVLTASDPEDREGIAFNYQQGAEKYVKAWLSYLEVEFSKTHKLQQLLYKLRPHYQPTSADLDAAEVLAPYAVEVRYPSEEELEPDMVVIGSAARHFYDLATRPLRTEPQLAAAFY